MKQMPFTPREQHLVAFSHAMALNGVGEVALRTYDDIMGDFERVRWWRYFARRRLVREADAVLRLYRVAMTYQHGQDPRNA